MTPVLKSTASKETSDDLIDEDDLTPAELEELQELEAELQETEDYEQESEEPSVSPLLSAPSWNAIQEPAKDRATHFESFARMWHGS